MRLSRKSQLRAARRDPSEFGVVAISDVCATIYIALCYRLEEQR